MKKLIFLTLIFCTSIFGAEDKHPQTHTSGKQNKDPEIVALEDAFVEVALSAIRDLFPQEIHEQISPDIAAALKMADKKHIPQIIEVLTQIIEKVENLQMGLNIIPDVIKWLIIGIDKDLSNEGPVEDQAEEESEFNDFGDKIQLPHRNVVTAVSHSSGHDQKISGTSKNSHAQFPHNAVAQTSHTNKTTTAKGTGSPTVAAAHNVSSPKSTARKVAVRRQGQ